MGCLDACPGGEEDEELLLCRLPSAAAPNPARAAYRQVCRSNSLTYLLSPLYSTARVCCVGGIPGP